jgi:hypothetical protein
MAGGGHFAIRDQTEHIVRRKLRSCRPAIRWTGRNVGLTVAVLGVLAFALRSTVAQEPADPSPFGRRFDGLRMLFALEKLEPGTLGDLEASDPKGWLLVVLDDPNTLQRINVRRFVERGGSVLVAGDRPMRGLGELGLSIAAGPIAASAGGAYRDVRACPVIRSWKNHPLFERVDSLTMNRPGWLVGSALGSYALAWAPAQANLSGEPFVVPPTVIAGGELGQGRFVVVADHSLFINEMLLELDNIVFARNAVRWLRRDRPADQCRVAFLEGSQEVTEWIDPRFASGDWSSFSLEDVVALVNELLVGLEEEDVFNRLLVESQGRLRGPTRSLALLIPAGLLAMLVLARWMAARRRPIGKPAGVLASFTSDALLEQRRLAIVSVGNFAEPAQALARNFFMQAMATALLPTTMPEAVIIGNGWRRWRVRRQLEGLWRLAHEVAPAQIGRGRFSRLTRQVAHLNRGFGQHEWWFRPIEATTANSTKHGDRI